MTASASFLVLINEVESVESKLSLNQTKFLAKFNENFVEDLPPGLPKSRPEDHAIEIIPVGAPTCRHLIAKTKLRKKKADYFRQIWKELRL